MRRSACTSIAFAILVALASASTPLASTTASAQTQPSVGRKYWRPPATIDRTGTTDVTADLERWLARVPDGSVIQLVAGTRYRLDGTVTLRDRHGLEIDGNGATVRAVTEGDRTRSQLRFEGGSDLRIHDLTIIGANPEAGVGEAAYRADREAQHAIELLSVSQVEVDHLLVQDTFGDGIYIGRVEDGDLSRQVWVHDLTIERTGRQGIAVTAGTDIVIEHNRLTQTRRATVDLEPNTSQGGVRRVAIIDNDIGPGRLRFVAAHGNGPVGEIVIARNHLRGHVLAVDVKPEDGARRADFWVIDNVSDTAADRTTLRFERIDGVVVRNNRQLLTAPRASQGEVGVIATDTCGLTVAANDFGARTEPVRLAGPPCGERPELAPPEPPTIPARAERPTGAPRIGPDRPPRSGEDAPLGSRTSTPPPARPAPTPGSAGPASERRPWLPVVLAAVLLVAAGAAGTALRVRKSSRMVGDRPK